MNMRRKILNCDLGKRFNERLLITNTMHNNSFQSSTNLCLIFILPFTKIQQVTKSEMLDYMTVPIVLKVN